MKAYYFKDKIHSLQELISKAEELRGDNKKIVFTNGCFDIIHRGHVSYLSEAAALGDFLIVGVNSDSSVQRLKGKNRPLQDETSRAEILAALECVGAIVIFSEDTPIELIKAIRPDVLVKGGDYSVDTVVGAQEVLDGGGSVELLSFLPGYSTSSIEDKIKGN